MRRGLTVAAALALAGVTLAADRRPPQINIEARFISVNDSNLRNRGLETGFGIGIEAIFHRPEGGITPTLGLQYDHVECEQDVFKLDTFGIQGGLLGPLQPERNPNEMQFLWRASVGFFRSDAQGPGQSDDTGFGYEVGIQYGPAGPSRRWSAAILYSVRPDAFNEPLGRWVGLLSFPIGGTRD
jgi:hypothetical protein